MQVLIVSLVFAGVYIHRGFQKITQSLPIHTSKDRTKCE